MKKILYVGAGAPWASGGGAGYLVRQGMFLRALEGLGELQLAMFDVPTGVERPAFAGGLLPLRVVRRGSGGGKLGQAWADVTGRLPRMVRDVDLEKTCAPVRALDLKRFDLVVAYRVDFAFFAGVLGHPKLLLDVDDPEHLRWRRREEARGGAIDWRTRRDLEKLRRFECEAVRGARQAFVCQEKERGAFSAGNVVVVPNGVEVRRDVVREVDGSGQVVVMLGNFAAGAGSPNDDALRWFVKEIWPLVRERCPGAEFRVVGKMAEQMRKELGGVAGVRVVGFVESLETVFAEARLSVAPLRFGTGTRVKILDSLAQGCPVVSTTAGADGLALMSGKNVLIADDAAGFAGRCSELLMDGDLASRLGMEGRRLVEDLYDRSAVERQLRKVFGEFLG